MIDRVAESLGAVADEVVLVANAPDAHAWLPGVRVERDVLPGLGALGGLHAAIAHARDAALVVAWDMPFVTAPLLRELRDVGLAGVDAAVAVGPDGAEPLCALYTRRCLDVAARLLDSGVRRARALGEAVRCATVDAARHGDPRALLLSVNTPADLATAESLSRSTRSPV
jgi:molybdopterin-guanine dinucleotide biosynthesis protein A